MTVADLATRDHADIGYLFVLQGCPFMYTDRSELAGSGASSWIDTTYGPRRVLEGLDTRGATITFATETGDGRPDTDDGLTIKIVDFDRELIAFFADQTNPSCRRLLLLLLSEQRTTRDPWKICGFVSYFSVLRFVSYFLF